jgi:predicted RND superfamily exporter protein
MHEKLERLMGRFGIWISDNPIKTIVMMLLLVSIPIVHVPQIKFDTSNEGFLHDKDPILLSYNDFRAQFGRDERIAVSIRSDEIFTLAFLQKLNAVHGELEENVPYLDEITSL